MRLYAFEQKKKKGKGVSLTLKVWEKRREKGDRQKKFDSEFMALVDN